MNNKPLVTVIMSFLNAERFIEEAIGSVFAQSYQNWELLLVDDGSTDTSTQIAQSYERNHPQRVRCLHHAGRVNLGISASQNFGIGEARGEYIGFLDADDVWLPNKLEEQVAILESLPEAAMVYGATQYWYSWTGDSEDARRDLFIETGLQPDTVVRPPELLVRLLRQEIPVPCPSDILLRRSRVIEAGGFEESFRRIFTDQVFYAKLCLKSPVYVAGQCWFKYRKHPDSAVSVVKKSGQLRASRLAYLNWLGCYLDRHEIRDREVRLALRSAKWKCRHPRWSRLAAHIRYRALIAGELLKSIARLTLPAAVYRRLRSQRSDRVGETR